MRIRKLTRIGCGILLAAATTLAALTPEQTREAQKLLRDFTAAEFATRQAAVEKLVAMGPDVLPIVERTLTTAKDNEVRLRCEMVVKGLAAKTAPKVAPTSLNEKFISVVGPVAYGKADQGWIRNDDGTSQIYRVLVKETKKFRVVHGTWESGDYDDVSTALISHAGDGSLFLAKRDGKMFMVINHAEQAAWESCGAGALSHDGGRWMYCGIRGGHVYAVVDGKVSVGYNYISIQGFTADNRHAAYVAGRGGKQFVVIDDREGPPHDQVYGLSAVKKPGDRYGPPLVRRFFALDGNRVRLVEYDFPKGGETEGEKLAEREIRVVADLPPGANSRHVATRDGKHYLSVSEAESAFYCDGKKVGTYEQIWNLTASDDGEHYGFIAKRDGQEFVVFDGKEGPAFDEVAHILLPEAQGHYTHNGRRGDRWHFVVDGREDATGYDFIEWRAISDNGRHAAYVAQQKNERVVVLDGREIARHEKAESLSYDPTGERLAYVAQSGGKCFVVVAGKRGSDFRSIVIPPRFSPDGTHLWYGVLENGVFFVVCDGIRGPVHDALAEVPHNANRKEFFRHIILQKGNDCLVEVAWPKGVDWTHGIEPLD